MFKNHTKKSHFTILRPKPATFIVNWTLIPPKIGNKVQNQEIWCFETLLSDFQTLYLAFPNFFWSRDEGKSVSTGQPPAATACPSVEAPLSSSFFFFSRTFTYGMRKLLWMLSWHESELHQPLFSHWKVSFGKSSRVRNVEPVGHQTWWWSCLIQKLLLRDPKNQNTCEKINNVWGHQKSKDEIWQQIIFFGKKWLSKSNQNVFWSLKVES